MKPEYWKETDTPCCYKVLKKGFSIWTVLEAGYDVIEIHKVYVSLLKDQSRPCTEAAFMKRYNQTIKKIERAVAK